MVNGFLSLACWKDISSYKKNDNQVPKVAGVDVGIQPLAFESDGTDRNYKY